MADQLSGTTSIFGLHLWVVVGICVGVAIVLFLFFISLWLASRRSKNKLPTIPVVSKEIQVAHHHQTQVKPDSFPDPDPLPEEENYNRIHIEIGKDHRISYPERYHATSSHGSGEASRSGGGGGSADQCPVLS